MRCLEDIIPPQSIPLIEPLKQLGSVFVDPDPNLFDGFKDPELEVIDPELEVIDPELVLTLEP
jgi:hypothetical protein